VCLLPYAGVYETNLTRHDIPALATSSPRVSAKVGGEPHARADQNIVEQRNSRLTMRTNIRAQSLASFAVAIQMIAGLILSGVAHAAPQFFTSQASFLAAVAGFQNVQSITFENLAAGTLLPSGTTLNGSSDNITLTYSIGGFSAKVANAFSTTSPSNSLGLTGGDEAFKGGDLLTMTFSRKLHALGLFVIGEDIAGGDLTLSVLDGNVSNGAVDPNVTVSGGQVFFLGVIDTNGFTSAVLSSRAEDYVFNVDGITTGSPAQFTLTLNQTGSGAGTVTSAPGGISCPADCAESYASGTVVTLIAAASSGSTFEGFGGDPDCLNGSVTVDSDKICTATFIPVSIVCSTQSLQAVVDSAFPGAVIPVSGSCNENITVRSDKERITLDGGGTATIHGPSTNSPTVNIRGKGILIQGFVITGGSDGVEVNRGSNAVVNNNVIQNSEGNGVVVNQRAFSVITNNMIQNNPGAGIVVSENSTARIGFNEESDTSVSANTIQNNAVGIIVSNSASARIIGNEVSSNTGDGIDVLRDSQADIANNTINGNGGDGIEIGEDSFVHLGEDSGPTIYSLPNATTVNNAGFGVKCTTGGLADGRQGTLTGTVGAISFDSSCMNSLSP